MYKRGNNKNGNKLDVAFVRVQQKKEEEEKRKKKKCKAALTWFTFSSPC